MGVKLGPSLREKQTENVQERGDDSIWTLEGRKRQENEEYFIAKSYVLCTLQQT